MKHKTLNEKSRILLRLNTAKSWLLVFILVVFSVLPQAAEAAGASLYLSPSSGTFLVGSTFSLSIVLDTKGNKINAVEIDLKFPPNILQVTSPTAGESFISEWLTPPSYSNTGGTISFKGGIPEGIVTSAGLVSTITFRAKLPGTAKVEFLSSSRVLLADGSGTPVFTKNLGGVYEILVPPQEGPRISSLTHPDSDVWYSNSSPVFSWEKESGVTDFSFSLSNNPQENPDTVSEGNETFKAYQDVQDDIWYFHLRSKKMGIWGKTSHFVVKIDTNPPQRFEPNIDAFNGFVYFETRDLHSGVDYYEISVLGIGETAPFFVETTSPFKISRQPGEYAAIVRAHDLAGNYQTAEARFQILSPFISIQNKGIQLRGVFFSTGSIYLVLFILLGGWLLLIFYLLRRRGLRGGIKEIKEALREIDKIEEKERETEKLREKFREEKEKLEEELGKH